MATPNYPRNGNQRSRPNHRKQTNGGDDLRFGPAPIRWIVFNKIAKMDSKSGFEMSVIVVEAIRGRCTSFMILKATVSEIFGWYQQQVEVAIRYHVFFILAITQPIIIIVCRKFTDQSTVVCPPYNAVVG